MSTEAPVEHSTPQPATTMAATNGQLIAPSSRGARRSAGPGQPPPGRPTLVRRTGATDHAVRKAMAVLAAESTSRGEPDDDSSPTDHPATTIHRATGGRTVAWAGFVFGSIMSIAANVLHTWLPAAHQSPSWSPWMAAQIGAAVWPIGLLLSVEVLSRVQWPQGWPWAIARFGGTGTVALGSAAISYGHLRDVLLAWQYNPLAAAVGPLVLDGLMVTSGIALLAISHTGHDQSNQPNRQPIHPTAQLTASSGSAIGQAET